MIDFTPIIQTLDNQGVRAALRHLVGDFGKEGERLAVTFAADCAERVLPVFEAAYPDDDRPRKAIEAVRLWLRGDAAAYAADAAGDAAAYAAGDAAADAAYAADAAGDAAAAAAAYAADAAGDAAAAAYAGDAAGDAAAAYAADAGDAAAAAYAADEESEREWQAARLREILSQ